jgi:hypothetical protein
MSTEDLYDKQVERETASANAGYDKFIKSEKRNETINNASSNTFGLALIRSRHEQIIENIETLIRKNIGTRVKQIRSTLELCSVFDSEGKPHDLMNIEVWAFLGLQAVLDNVFNPVCHNRKDSGKFGGDKNLIARKSQSELELYVGKLINDNMALTLIKETFPNWFRVADKFAKRVEDGGIRATPDYWKKRMTRSINKFAEKLEDGGDIKGAEFIRNRKPWSVEDCRVVGELVVLAVLMANQDYLKSQTIQVGKKKQYDIVLTAEGLTKSAELREYVAQYSHDVLPMLIQPNIITNDSLGGWLKEILQEPEVSRKGEIILSDKHLEFINRQAKVQFEINPFSYELIRKLKEEQKQLGKFHYIIPQTMTTVAEELGLSGYQNSDDLNSIIERLPKAQRREARRAAAKRKHDAFLAASKNIIAQKLLDMSEKLIEDECFYIPMKYDARGRVYSRVPFLSFQGTDAGKYLLRFHKKTPVDDRTQHWLKIGISNAGGNDKLCWDDRIKWFDRNLADIINVGKMLDDGDFDRAYEFLTQDGIEDPFALAAIANEYVRIFVDKTQNHTQVFILVDASCSGTSIFNAWRLNKHGALKTNLIDTPAPADIYMEVWHEIKRLLPAGSVRTSFIKRLEASKLLRKMMKSVYVPASYASPKGEQLMKLKVYNEEVLTPANLAFKEEELKELQTVWPVALDNVSSINTVVGWFRDRTKEAVDNGSKEIVVTSSNGSRMILRYPQSTLRAVPVVGNTTCQSRRKYLSVDQDEPNRKKLLDSITANVTHMTDASCLVEALYDWEVPFVGVHDAVGIPACKDLDEGLCRLKEGLITATRHNIWDTFRKDNNLPLSPTTAAPIIGDLDLDLIKNSNYIFS